jgi:hypothetical protein
VQVEIWITGHDSGCLYQPSTFTGALSTSVAIGKLDDPVYSPPEGADAGKMPSSSLSNAPFRGRPCLFASLDLTLQLHHPEECVPNLKSAATTLETETRRH